MTVPSALMFPTLAPHLRRVFGVVISSDFPLDRLPEAAQSRDVSVTMRHSGQEWYHPEVLDGDSDRFLREPNKSGVRYVAGGVGEFLIEDHGRLITYSLAPGAAGGDVQHILTGPALVMALQLQGEFFLHAGAVERDGAMFALSAPHGFGKSTLTASFHDFGCTVHSDDVVPIAEVDGRVVGRQGQPWIKLWDNVLGQFGKDAKQFDEVLEGLGKRIVPGIAADGEVPLRCVYLLAPHLSNEKPVEFRQLSGLEGALALLANIYSPEIIVGELAASSLTFATRIAGSVPVRVVSYYRSFEALPSIREAILRDFEGLTHA